MLYIPHEVNISESGECSEIKQYITFFDQMPEAIGEQETDISNYSSYFSYFKTPCFNEQVLTGQTLLHKLEVAKAYYTPYLSLKLVQQN